MNNDAIAIAPHIHKVLIDNERVRVLEINISPGVNAALHKHPDNVLVVLEGGTLDLTGADGNTRKMEFQTGSAIFLESLEHSVINSGNSTIKMIQVELK
jgi:beta-alanine degradation protein BauB